MAEIKSHVPGTFSWIDLATKDPDASKSFYSELFGLNAVDTPAGEDMVYTMLNLDEKAAAGLYEMSREQQNQGIPPYWLSYVTVENVDEAMAKVKSLGGTVIEEAFDVFEAGRMGLIQDPTGAVLALWQPKENIGAYVMGEPGTLAWNELITSDTEKAEAFYTGLFGWGSHTEEMIDIMYTVFLIGERQVAGMLKMPPEMGEVPSHWMVYFSVADCDQTAAKAQELGANMLQPPTDVPGTGRFAVLQDPQGAAFGIIALEPME